MLSVLRKNNFIKLSKQLLVVAASSADLTCQQPLRKTIRTLSTLNDSIPLAGATVYKDDRREFMAILPDLIKDLTEYASKYGSKDAVKLYKKALQYNVSTGKQNLGIFTLQMFKMLADKTQLNSENIKLAHYLGWCVEMVMTLGYMLDDIEDEGVRRLGKPCWYKLDEVGLSAINDSLMILNGIYHILKENFAQKDYYVKLLELFHDALFIGTLGQSMDLQASKSCATSFTMDQYKSIVANKTSYPALYLPIELAMHLCGITDPEIFKQTRAILLQLGYFFQIENDYKDCFGDPEKTGKIGTDIQENRCSWLAVVCVENATEAQKDIMRECYGKSDPVKIAQVKRLYEELELPKIFTAYKEETINTVKTRIQEDPSTVPVHLYKVILPFLTTKNWSNAFDFSHSTA